MHAVPDDLWAAVDIDSRECKLRHTFDVLGEELVVYRHIHKAGVRVFPSLTVANTGSVSNPLDGDPRASSLLISDGVAENRRVGYEYEKAVADLAGSGLPEDAVAALSRIYRTGLIKR